MKQKHIFVFIMVILLCFAACDNTINPGGTGNMPDLAKFTTIAQAKLWLARQPGGDNATDPLELVMLIDLGSSSNVLSNLLRAINETGKFVELDLSDCIMGGSTVFYNAHDDAGYVVSLILPDTALTMADQVYLPNLYSFKALNLTSIPDYGFYGNDSLTELELPNVTSIGSNAFRTCVSLVKLDLPSVTSIGSDAFMGCVSLSELNLPNVTAIGNYAFYNTGDTALTITMGMFPPTLGLDIFFLVAAPRSVTVKVPASSVNFYGGEAVHDEQTDYTDNWANGFRGAGWDGVTMQDTSCINNVVSLTVESL